MTGGTQNFYCYFKQERYLVFSMAIIALFSGLVFELMNLQVRMFADSFGYLDLAKTTTIYQALFAMRPFFSVLFFKLFINNIQSIFYVQAFFYFLSWSYLIFVLTKLLKNIFVFVFSCIICICLALYPDFVLWIGTALTESMSFSLSVLSIAFFLQYLHNKKRTDLFILVTLLVIAANFRDVNAYYALFFIAPFITGCLWIKAKKLPVLIALACLFVGAFFTIWSADNTSPPRWYFSMWNNIGKRILTNPVFYSFYKQKGMPESRKLMTMKNLYAYENRDLIYQEAMLAEFRYWLCHEGKRVYAQLLIAFPFYTVSVLWNHSSDIFHHNHFALKFYAPEHFHYIESMKNELGLVYAADLFLLALLFIMLALKRFREGKLRFLLGLFYCSLCIPMALVAYHADAAEVARHTLMVPFHACLSLILLLYLIDNNPEDSLEFGQTPEDLRI